MSQHADIVSQTQRPPDGRRAEVEECPRVVVPRQAEPLRPADDEILKLVQRVFLLPAGTKRPHAVAFCGVNSGAGCTWVCARAGESLARQVAGRVCLVDVNLRAPSLYRQFQAAESPGFVEFMKGSVAGITVAQRICNGNLWLISAGTVENERNGTLTAEKLRARFSALQAEFDFVLLDTPAADRFADSLQLAQLTDGVILVLGSNTTRRETARNAKANFEAVQVPVLGAVLNKRTYPIPDAIYRNI